MLNSGVLGSSLFSAPLPLRPSGRDERAALARLETRLFRYRRASVFTLPLHPLVLLCRAKTPTYKGRCRISLAERPVLLLGTYGPGGVFAITKKNNVIKKK